MHGTLCQAFVFLLFVIAFVFLDAGLYFSGLIVQVEKVARAIGLP
jgi:hypothetical protein